MKKLKELIGLWYWRIKRLMAGHTWAQIKQGEAHCLKMVHWHKSRAQVTPMPVTKDEAIHHLFSEFCYACGLPKQKMTSLCWECFQRLDFDRQGELRRMVGEGYLRAYNAALTDLEKGKQKVYATSNL